MNLNELLKTTPESLARTQINALKEHVLNILEEFHVAIKEERFDDAKKMTFESPSGDAYGRDDTCINFSWEGKQDSIQEFFYEIDKLSRITENNNDE